MSPRHVRTEDRISSAELRDSASARWTVDTVARMFVHPKCHLHFHAHTDRCRSDVWSIESVSVAARSRYSSRTYPGCCQNKRSRPDRDRNPAMSSVHPRNKCPGCARFHKSKNRRYSRVIGAAEKYHTLPGRVTHRNNPAVSSTDWGYFRTATIEWESVRQCKVHWGQLLQSIVSIARSKNRSAVPDVLIIVFKAYLLEIFHVWIDSVNDKVRLDDVFTVRLAGNHRADLRHFILDLEMVVSPTQREGSQPSLTMAFFVGVLKRLRCVPTRRIGGDRRVSAGSSSEVISRCTLAE